MAKATKTVKKITIGLISKKATLHVQHTLFVHFFAVVLHDYNVKLPETFLLHVFWGKCRTCSRSLFFSLPLIFTLHWCRYHFSFCHRCYKVFMLFFHQKNISFVFFSRWASLSFSSIFQICGHDNWSIKLNTLHTTETETISAFRFRRYWLLSCLCFTRRWWLCDFLPK